MKFDYVFKIIVQALCFIYKIFHLLNNKSGNFLELENMVRKGKY